MKKRFRICMLFLLLAAFVGLTGVTSAQDIDLDSMSSEQLNALLQALTEKLGQREAPDGEEPGIEVSAPSDTADSEEEEETARKDSSLQVVPSDLSEKQVTQASAEKKYQIYENKKLVIGRMPDSMFIRREDLGGGGEEKDESSDPPAHECEPGCSWDCGYDWYGNRHCGCYCG